MTQVEHCEGEITGLLREKIEVLHDKMDNIIKHASDRCRKILTPESESSPEMQWLYNRIHT